MGDGNRSRGLENKSPEFIARIWKPGQSGNPKGRPKVKSFETRVMDMLSEAIGETGEDKGDLIVRRFIKMLIEGDGPMLREFLARMWPAIVKLDIDMPERRSHEFIPDEAEQQALANEFKGNGKDTVQ